MSEQPGQEPTAADTTPTVDPAPAEQVQVTTSEPAAAPQAPAPVVTEPVVAPADPAPTAADVPKAEEPKTFDEAYVRKLRDEAAANRVKAKELEDAQKADADKHQSTLDGIAKALGLKSDDEAAPPTAEELTAQLTTAQQTAAARETELRTLRVETAAAKAARTHGADVDALLDSRSFADKLSELDPSTDGFTTALDALVAKAVEDNPKYKTASPAPAVSSGDFSGGSGDKVPTRNDIDDFRKARKARSGLD